jgi:hypothetical protein
MGEKDQKEFKDAVAKAKSTFIVDWRPALDALNRLAMFDMLPALASLKLDDNGWNLLMGMVTGINLSRLRFARQVIVGREIYDFGIAEGQVNDGREFLGCTRLDDDGVKRTIEVALNDARIAIRDGTVVIKGKDFVESMRSDKCCGDVGVAWYPVLVMKRREKPRASLISNLAAAAHYMLARYHVCAAKASQVQMAFVIEGYDAKKRLKIGTGDPDLKSMALTPGNRPFPPDFAIRNWAYKGAVDGDVDRVRCNSNADLPTLFPTRLCENAC